MSRTIIKTKINLLALKRLYEAVRCMADPEHSWKELAEEAKHALSASQKQEAA